MLYVSLCNYTESDFNRTSAGAGDLSFEIKILSFGLTSNASGLPLGCLWASFAFLWVHLGPAGLALDPFGMPLVSFRFECPWLPPWVPLGSLAVFGTSMSTVCAVCATKKSLRGHDTGAMEAMGATGTGEVVSKLRLGANPTRTIARCRPG